MLIPLQTIVLSWVWKQVWLMETKPPTDSESIGKESKVDAKGQAMFELNWHAKKFI